jgi:hypothetical protein
MLRSRSFLVGSGLLAAFSAVACSSDSLTTPGTTSLEITTSTSGTELDADGYTVQVDAGAAQTIGASASMQRTDLSPGDHTVQLGGMALNCSVTGDNPRTVSVAAGQTATVSFAVTCGPTTGGLEVTSTTTGPSPDADGFTVTVDGAERGTLGASGAVNVDGLTGGNHVVGISGVAANCQVQGDNPRTVIIAPGTPSSVPFTVTCTAPPAGAGTLRVKTATTGADLDPDGYTLSVDGGKAQPIGVNGTAVLANIAGGTHSVKLTGAASNCTIQGANPRSASVSAGATVEVSFTVTCGSSGMTWTTVPLPSDFVASALWASSPSDLFVVARSRSAPSIDPNYVLRYDGQSWTEQFHGTNWTDSPNAIWGSSPTDVFVAGERHIWHYNGTQWQDTSRELELYRAIWGSSPQDVYAVGVPDASPESGLILHYDGRTWEYGGGGRGWNPGTAYEVAGSSSRDVYVLGIESAPPDAPPELNYSTSRLMHYDGNTWNTSFESRIEGPNDFSANGVWAIAPNDAFLVGSSGRILHFDGTTWSPMTSPTSQHLVDVWGNSSSNVYAVGGGILHYDGTTWTVIKNTASTQVWGVGTDVFVITSSGEVMRGTP